MKSGESVELELLGEPRCSMKIGELPSFHTMGRSTAAAILVVADVVSQCTISMGLTSPDASSWGMGRSTSLCRLADV